MFYDQFLPAGLVQLLLLRAGIESNPGPTSKPPCRTDTEGRVYICCVCLLPLHSSSSSVRCKLCKEWCHFRKKVNCSQLKKLRDHNDDWICSTCENPPTPSPTPSPPSTPPPSPPPSPTPAPPPPSDKASKNYELKIL